ncbi:hypothetical protein VTO42DRAFT_8622 [Malbranchea cinnamomea]
MNWGLFFLLIIPLLLCFGVAWIVYTQVRARRAGLPPPSWRAYIPFTSASSTYRDSSFPSPRRGGIVDWFRDQYAKIRYRRTHRGAYEDMESRRTAYGGGEHDEVWDSRLGGDDTGYGQGGPRGYYEEHEFDFVSTLRDSPYNSYSGQGYTVKDDEPERGRTRSRDPPVQVKPSSPDELEPKPLPNPFGDNAEVSQLRDVSPRPEQGSAVASHQNTSQSPTGGRSPS